MRRIVSLFASAVLAGGLSLSTAAPASAAGDPYCFGLPSEPLAYVCVTVHEDPPPPDPTVTWGEPFYVTHVPAVCYGLGCTEEGPFYLSLPWVTGLGVPTLVEVYWGGQGTIDVKQIVTEIRGRTESVLQCLRPPFHCPAWW